MTKETFEAKIQPMPEELKESFRVSLDFSTSKKMVNRLMGIVLKAYAQGQRDAEEKRSCDDYTEFYEGAEALRKALVIISDMSPDEMLHNFGAFETFIADYLPYIIKHFGPKELIEKADIYNQIKLQEKAKQERKLVEEIGVDRVLEIVNEIRNEELPE